MDNHKLGSVIGITIAAVAIVGFILALILKIPSKEEAYVGANPIKEIPRNLFSNDNPTTQKIRQLTIPGNVPVQVDPGNVGRPNAFENF